MPFQSEAEMYDTALNHLPDYFGISESYAAIAEFQVGYRRIDIALLAIPSNYESYDLSALLRLNAHDLWAVSVLFSLRDPQTSNSDGPNKMERYFEPIKHHLQVLKNEFGQIAFEDMITNLRAIQEDCLIPPILVELKIRDWRNLILQSHYCKRNANLVCAILDREFGDRVDHSPFSRAGIGLFFASQDSLEVMVHPEREIHSPMSPEIHFNYLRMLKSLLSPNNRWQIIC